MELVITEHDHDEQFADFLVGKYINVTAPHMLAGVSVFDMHVLGHDSANVNGFVRLYGDEVDMEEADVPAIRGIAVNLADIRRLEIY